MSETPLTLTHSIGPCFGDVSLDTSRATSKYGPIWVRNTGTDELFILSRATTRHSFSQCTEEIRISSGDAFSLLVWGSREISRAGETVVKENTTNEQSKRL